MHDVLRIGEKGHLICLGERRDTREHVIMHDVLRITLNAYGREERDMGAYIDA